MEENNTQIDCVLLSDDVTVMTPSSRKAIKFSTKCLFRIFLILRTDGMAPFLTGLWNDLRHSYMIIITLLHASPAAARRCSTSLPRLPAIKSLRTSKLHKLLKFDSYSVKTCRLIALSLFYMNFITFATFCVCVSSLNNFPLTACHYRPAYHPI